MRTPSHFLAASACALSLLGGAASASQLEWSGQKYSFYLDEEPVESVIREIAAREGIPVEIADAVEAQVSGRFEDVTGSRLFRELLSGYGLVHYYDGYTLHVVPVGDAVSETVELSAMTPNEFRDELAANGIYDDRFYLAGLDREGVVLVSGPRPYVERVQEVAGIIERRGSAYTLVYRWTDERGQTHFTTNAARAPEGASTVRMQRSDSGSGGGVDGGDELLSLTAE